MRFLSINAVLVVLMANDHGGNAMMAGNPGQVVIPARSGSFLRSVGEGKEITRRPLTSGIKFEDDLPTFGESGVVYPNDLRIRKLRMLKKPGEGLEVGAIRGFIQRYNHLVVAGKTNEKDGLLGVEDDYEMTLYTFLCVISTGKIELTNFNICKTIGEDKFRQAVSDLTHLLVEADPTLSEGSLVLDDSGSVEGDHDDVIPPVGYVPVGDGESSHAILPSLLRGASGEELDGQDEIFEELSRLESRAREGMPSAEIAQIISDMTRLAIPDNFVGLEEVRRNLMKRVGSMMREAVAREERARLHEPQPQLPPVGLPDAEALAAKHSGSFGSPSPSAASEVYERSDEDDGSIGSVGGGFGSFSNKDDGSDLGSVDSE